MARLPRRLLALLVLAAAIPAAAQAADPLAGARLAKATGSLEIEWLRCPPGTERPAAGACDLTRLRTQFTAPANPPVRRTAGLAQFPSGLRIAGTGTTSCSSQTPVQLLETPLGQQMTSATRASSVPLARTDVLVRSDRRGLRVAWLEPARPAVPCGHFDDPATLLALPAPSLPATVPQELVSDPLRRAATRRRSFGTRIDGQRAWVDSDAEGRSIHASAHWRFDLGWRRAGGLGR